ncbi:YraN family protein [Litoribrevibacter albus]|uniref:UPF0102 protein GCM10007876_37230 n=1 Tax=Litoribrevibacter albus TaxID=1473156 RepID=A0AA37SET2_9GAMM|nr:YraN family protein [Litoribrevibacter albus]GLQ33243.1 UPF0102 protein [Litoribrevibacter albus]
MKQHPRTLKSTKAIGDQFEAYAKNFLIKQGIKLLSSNFYAKSGEIDLIGKDGDILIFFEVRARSNIKHGRPEETVTPKKQMRIRRTASKFLQTNSKYQNTLCRFDVISIIYTDKDQTINWIKNAF